MKTYFFGSHKSGKDLLSKIPIENLTGSEINGLAPNWQDVAKADCLWFFATAERFNELHQQILMLNKPIIINLGLEDLPTQFISQLKQRRIKCVYGPRICLGMNLLTPFIDFLNKGHLFWNDLKTQVHDVASSDESLSPTNVAKEWNDQVDPQAKILVDRISNNPGQTHITVSSENESIQISHKIHDRNAFVQGALWASYKILFSDNQIQHLNRFEELFWQTEANESMMTAANLSAEA